MLTAKAYGTKLRPFLLLNRKRPIKELEQFRGQLIIKYEGTNWMNDDLTEMYIKEVIDKNLFGQRLLMWVALNATLVLGQKNFSLEEMWTWRLHKVRSTG